MLLIRRLLALSALVLAVGCGSGDAPDAPPPSESGLTLNIVSGSENKGLEPIIDGFARERGVEIRMHYQGSVDIALELENGLGTSFDAVWPANSLWIVLGDRQKVVKYEKSIMRSPVVFALRKSVAERLGWINKSDLQIEDILLAAESGQLRFAMTSATQSNSGASAYFGFLSAMAGTPEVLRQEHLADSEVRDKVRRLLTRVDRSSGSSGWLKDMLVDRYERFDAMVNYEAMVIEANQELIRRGQEPLFAVYPIDGMTIADSPLGYVDHGDPAKEELFLELQSYLLSPDVQSRIGALGRRTGLLGLDASSLDPATFNPAWGIDPRRIISSVPVPEEAVIRAALDLYQTALRKPSLTAYVLDFSGSMNGDGERQLKDAMATLLDVQAARRYLLQPSDKDIHIIVPFDSRPRQALQMEGNDEVQLRQLLGAILDMESGGGTNIYTATAAAVQAIEAQGERISDYFPAIILMSDGKSKEDWNVLKRTLDTSAIGYDVPIFSIAFGEADETQLKQLADLTSARVFDGKRDLVKAFRKAKGYN